MSLLYNVVLLVLALVANNAAAQEGRFIRLGCGQLIALEDSEPTVLGGLMLRGHGPVIVAGRLPTISRVHVHVFRSSDAPEERIDAEANGVPLSHDDAEAVFHAMDSLFSMGHPMSLFKEDLAELDRWHAVRMRALDVLRANMMRNALEDAAQLPEVVESEAGNEYQEQVEPSQPSEIFPRKLGADPEDVGPDLEDYPFPLTPVNACGIVLLSLAFTLLVAMMVLSLAAVCDGCTESGSKQPLAVGDADSLVTPLLKGEEKVEHEAMFNNPLAAPAPPAPTVGKE